MSVRRFVLILCVSLAVATALRFAAYRREKNLSISRLAHVSKPQTPARSPRKIYPYSVIPGGAYSSDELALARRVDRVVAAHYSDFETADVAVRALPQDTYLYVSYRKGDRVYWTANKRRIPKGETVLSDGKHMARTRCGNRLSAAPQFPIAAGPQPTEAALNAPELPAGIELPQAPLFAPQYDAPVMPLADARDRLFAFPTGTTGASQLAQAFPPWAPPSPMMVVGNLPFGAPGVPATTAPGGGTSGTSSPTGSTPVGSGPGGSGPGGSSPGGGGPLPGAPVPEPASARLIAAAGAAVLLFAGRRFRNRR